MVIEVVKNEIKKQERGFLAALSAPLAVSVVQPVNSSVLKGITGRRVMRAGREYCRKLQEYHLQEFYSNLYQIRRNKMDKNPRRSKFDPAGTILGKIT